MLSIRLEKPEDIELIYRLNQLAFDRTDEAELVDGLRDAGALSYSLVAFYDSELVGHLAFSPVTIHHNETVYQAIGLAPIAVKPTHQRQGIGTKLFEYWLNNFDIEQHNLVVVLGDPKFYLSLGFLQADTYRIKWEIDVPPEAFMVRELQTGALSEIKGIVKYHPQFDEL